MKVVENFQKSYLNHNSVIAIDKKDEMEGKWSRMYVGLIRWSRSSLLPASQLNRGGATRCHCWDSSRATSFWAVRSAEWEHIPPRKWVRLTPLLRVSACAKTRSHLLTAISYRNASLRSIVDSAEMNIGALANLHIIGRGLGAHKGGSEHIYIHT